jgi:glycosyltransferase involved in cell wall biosynthesis
MNINYYAPINSTGYGIASLYLLNELNSISDVSLFPIGNVSLDSRYHQNLVQNCYNKSLNFDPYAPCLKIWHQFDLATRIGRGTYFALPFFELDTFNSMEIKHLSVPDVVFATSEWGKQVILNNNPNIKCEVVPLGVDNTIFNPDKITKSRQDDKYIFLNIGKWEKRKGHDILLELFNKAFSNNENVELWILASESTNNYSTKEELLSWKQMYNSPRIKIFNGVQSHIDIAYLIAESDCGIYPSRAEGWNLELLETMAMNKPVISTNYSAHTEYCTKDNCYLVEIDNTELANDGKAFKNQGNWAKIDQKQKDQFIDYMRYVYNNRIIDNPSGLETAKKLSWKNSAKKIMGYI